MDSESLVPGRACGECTVCCAVLAIDHEEFQKDAGVRCRHATARCGIYAERPTPCREFFCGWRLIPGLDDAWRPDLSGILLFPDSHDVGGKTESAVTIFLLRDAAATLAKPGLLAFVAAAARNDRILYLGKTGYPGFRPIRVQVNSPQMRAAANAGSAQVHAILKKGWEFLNSQPHPPHTPCHRGNRDAAAAQEASRGEQAARGDQA